MSNKIKHTGEKGRMLRLSALVPALFSLTAFILQIVSVLSGMHPGQFQQYSIMTLNTSTLGQNLIQFTPVETQTTIAKAYNPLDPFGLLPTPTTTTSSSGMTTTATATTTNIGGEIISVVKSLTSAIGGILPTTLPTTLPSIDASSSLSDIFTLVLNYFEGIITNSTTGIAGTIDDVLNNLETSLVSGVTEELGIQQYYSLHLMAVCGGNLSSPTDLNAKFTIKSCTSYSKLLSDFKNSSIDVPNYLVVLSTNISVPILGQFPTFAQKTGHTLTILEDFSLAIHILSLIGTGGTAILSFIAIFAGNSALIVELTTLTSFLGASFQTVFAVLVTVIITYGSSIINQIGNMLGIYSKHGNQFLIVTWVAFVLAQLAGFYWDAVFFVETRRTSFKRRERTAEEKGNYKGIWKEIRRDLKKTNKEDHDDIDEKLIGNRGGVGVERRVRVTREKVGDGDDGTYVYRVTADGDSPAEPMAHGALNSPSVKSG